MQLIHARTLITGKPGAGKTTLVQKIIAQMGPVTMAGFCTTEIRRGANRVGFELQGLNGMRRILAHVDIAGTQRIGKYGVDTAGFDEYLEALDLLDPGTELIVIDEIGKMEIFSSRFRRLVVDALNSGRQVLATVALKGGEFIRQIRQREDVHLFEVTPANRDRLPKQIMKGF